MAENYHKLKFAIFSLTKCSLRVIEVSILTSVSLLGNFAYKLQLAMKIFLANWCVLILVTVQVRNYQISILYTIGYGRCFMANGNPPDPKTMLAHASSIINKTFTFFKSEDEVHIPFLTHLF